MYTTYKTQSGEIVKLKKSEYVNMLYDQNPTWSYNQIAKKAKCSKQTVSKALLARGVRLKPQGQNLPKKFKALQTKSDWNTEIIHRKPLNKHIVEVIAPRDFIENYELEITANNQIHIVLK